MLEIRDQRSDIRKMMRSGVLRGLHYFLFGAIAPLQAAKGAAFRSG
jgi:hypothetical protein